MADKMDHQMNADLKERVAALHAADDETGNGIVDLPDMKLQLDRIEAQLELQDKQNRQLLKNQQFKFVLTCVIVVALCVVVGILWYKTNMVYAQVAETCDQVNQIAGTLQDSLNSLDGEQLNSIAQNMPEITEKLSSIDVDSLNSVLAKLPAMMDTVSKLQTQVDSLTSFLNNVSGGLAGGLTGLLGGT